MWQAAALAFREICCLPRPLASKVEAKDDVKGLTPASSNATSFIPAATLSDSKNQAPIAADTFMHTEALVLRMPEQSRRSRDIMCTVTTSSGTKGNKDMHTLTESEGTYTDVSLHDTKAEEPDSLDVSQYERDGWIGTPLSSTCATYRCPELDEGFFSFNKETPFAYRSYRHICSMCAMASYKPANPRI